MAKTGGAQPISYDLVPKTFKLVWRQTKKLATAFGATFFISLCCGILSALLNPETKDRFGLLSQIPVGPVIGVILLVLACFGLLIANYYFNHYFLKVLGAPLVKAGVGSFFRYLKTQIQVFLIFLSVEVLAAIFSMGLSALMHIMFLGVVLTLVANIYALFVFFRLSFATNFCLLRTSKPVRDSWRLTKGHVWTLFWAGLIVGCGPALAENGILFIQNQFQISSAILLVILSGLIALNLLLLAAYSAVAFQTIYFEERKEGYVHSPLLKKPSEKQAQPIAP
jgi:hypothetical protein